MLIKMGIKDLKLVPDDELALERIVHGLEANIPNKSQALYDLLQRVSKGTITFVNGVRSCELSIPEAHSEEEKLRASIAVYINVFDKLKKGWNIEVVSAERVLETLDVSKYYSAF